MVNKPCQPIAVFVYLKFGTRFLCVESPYFPSTELFFCSILCSYHLTLMFPVGAGIWSCSTAVTACWRSALVLPCRVVGEPRPDVVWTRNEQALQKSEWVIYIYILLQERFFKLWYNASSSLIVSMYMFRPYGTPQYNHNYASRFFIQNIIIYITKYVICQS